MGKEDSAFLSCVGILMLAAVTIFVSAVANGFVLVKLWSWFILARFEAAPVLDIPSAIGFAMVVGFLTSDWSNAQNKEDNRSQAERWIYVILMAIGKRLVYLAIGYIVHSFM